MQTKQPRSIQVGIETGVLFSMIILFFSGANAIFDPVVFFFSILLSFIFAGFFAPYVYERFLKETTSVIGVLCVFYVHAVILFLASIIYGNLRPSSFLSPSFLLIVTLSA
ncbi:MAG: hypothetical protein ACTSVM_00530, partial [Candidatus Ranarchaeia archaeon]